MFWGRNTILDVAMDRSRSVLAACIALPGQDTPASLYAAVVWAVPSGIPLAVVDLRPFGGGLGSRVDSAQVLLHPTEPLIVMGVSEQMHRRAVAGSSPATYRTLVVHWATGA